MKLLILAVALIGILSPTSGWVILDSRNDMLAMSSEVSEGAVAYAAPSQATTLGSVDDEAVTAVPENVAEVSNDVPTQTTEEQSLADNVPVPEPEPEVIPTESKLSEGQDAEQTTQGIQQDLPEVTTETSLSSSSASFLEDDIQSEDMHIKVIPDTPIAPPRQNPNSIEEDEQLASVVVVSKKKHEIFNGKKSKFSM